jgi:hypothetical protein
MSRLGKQLKALDERSKRLNPAPTSIGQVLTIKPLSVAYNGLTLSFANGDNIYINNLMLDDNINIEARGNVNNPQNIKSMNPQPWIAQDTPNGDYTAEISGSQLDLLTGFYDWFKAVHDRFIIHIGDYVAVQKLGNNTYLILDKLQKVENEQ